MNRHILDEAIANVGKKLSIDGNEVIRQIQLARDRTPNNSGTITASKDGRVLAAVRDSTPLAVEEVIVTKGVPTSLEMYNDFLIQNDIETNPYKEIGNLADRKMEIQQNEDEGEFMGMELESSMPSYEAVQNMDDEQYAQYKAKYLMPNKYKGINIDVKKLKDSGTAVEAMVKDGIALDQVLQLHEYNLSKQ